MTPDEQTKVIETLLEIYYNEELGDVLNTEDYLFLDFLDLKRPAIMTDDQVARLETLMIKLLPLEN